MVYQPEPLIGIDEAAEYLGVNKRWMYDNQASRNIPRRTIAGRFKYRLSELSEWADGQRVAALRAKAGE